VKRFYLLGTLLSCACAPERLVEIGPAPQLSAEKRALADSEYVAACEHRPGARYRLYGCKAVGPQRIPLFIVDGRPLPTDTIGPGKVVRERFMAELNGNHVEMIEVITANDSSAQQLYGMAAQFGVVKITLLPRFKTTSPRTQPNTR
jgi:hypothetical protein